MNYFKLIKENTIYGSTGIIFDESEYSYIPDQHKPYFKKVSSPWGDLADTTESIPIPTSRARGHSRLAFTTFSRTGAIIIDETQAVTELNSGNSEESF